MISTFDYVEVEKYKGDPNMVASILIKYCLNVWFDDLNKTPSELDKYFTQIFFSLYDLEDKSKIDLATQSFIRLVQAINSIESLIENAKYVVPNIDFYFPMGHIYRKSYKSIIDLMIVNDQNEVSILLIGPKMNPAYNLKTHVALDYAREADINIKYVYYLNYNHNFINRDVYLDRITPTDLIRKISKSANRIKLQDVPNITYCIACPYRDKCSLNDLVFK